jgi:hypothetical protein
MKAATHHRSRRLVSAVGVVRGGERLDIRGTARPDRSGGLLNLPEARIMRDETCRVHLEFGDESAACALVTIGRGINAAIELLERLERETWEAQPRSVHLRFLSDGQIQAPNGKEIGGWAEIEVQIDAGRHLGTFCSIEPPATSRIHGEFDLDRLVPDPARNLPEQRPPARIAHHEIVQAARLLVVCKYRGSG